MVYVFTNIYRFKSDQSFIDAVKSQFSPSEGDTFLFLNECIPLMHGADYFKTFDIMTLHRRMGMKDMWFGYDKIRKSGIPIGRMLRADDYGNVIDSDGNSVVKLDFGNYPKNKIPTTGYLAYLLLPILFSGEDYRFVNYYGMDDSSAIKISQHDWKYEDVHFRAMRGDKSVFVEPLSDDTSNTKQSGYVVTWTKYDIKKNPYFFGAKID